MTVIIQKNNDKEEKKGIKRRYGTIKIVELR